MTSVIGASECEDILLSPMTTITTHKSRHGPIDGSHTRTAVRYTVHSHFTARVSGPRRRANAGRGP